VATSSRRWTEPMAKPRKSSRGRRRRPPSMPRWTCRTGWKTPRRPWPMSAGS
jgi:hypothetical protein